MDREQLNQKQSTLPEGLDEAMDALLRASLREDIEVPDGFAPSVNARIAAEAPRVRRARVHRLAPWFKGLAAVAAAGVVFVAVQGLSPGTEPPSVADDPGLSVAETPEPALPDLAEPGQTEEPTEPAQPAEPTQPQEPATQPDEPAQPAEPSAGQEDPGEPAVPERQVDDVDLSDEVRLDAVVSIASEAGRMPSGTLDLTPLYDGPQRALAPSISDEGDVLFFLAEDDGSYSLMRKSDAQSEAKLVAGSLSSDEVGIQEAMSRPISKQDLSIEDDALYYKDIQILPAFQDADLDVGLAPNGVFVAVNAKSDIEAIEGLWVTDIYNANMGKLSTLGGGRILAWAPDSSSLLFTDREGSIYLGDIAAGRTYLVAQDGDAGSAVANYSADASRFVIACQVGGEDGIYLVDVPR